LPGHYVPQLAELLYDRNKDTHNYPYINFKGFIQNLKYIASSFSKHEGGMLSITGKHTYLYDGFLCMSQVGNPETDEYYDSKGLLEYAWSHTVVSDQVYKLADRVCDFKLFNWTDECNDAMEMVFNQYKEIDIYNVYAPKCTLPQSSSSFAFDEDNAKVSRNVQ
ncbi:hypothetical protein BHM03_00003621, partial [Ensete ventricosum]